MQSMLSRSTWRSIIRLHSAGLRLHKSVLYQPFHSGLLMRQLDGETQLQAQQTLPGSLKRELCHHCWSWLPPGQLAAHIASHHPGMQARSRTDSTSTNTEVASGRADHKEQVPAKPSKAMCQHCGRFVPFEQMDEHVKEHHHLQWLDSRKPGTGSDKSRVVRKSRRQASSKIEDKSLGHAKSLADFEEKNTEPSPQADLNVASGSVAPPPGERDVFAIASSLTMCPKCEKFVPLDELDSHIKSVHQHAQSGASLPSKSRMSGKPKVPGGSKRPWNAEDIAKAGEMLDRGLTDEEIGRVLHRAPSSVALVRRRKIYGTCGWQWTREERDRLDELFKSGMSDTEIGKLMGRPKSMVSRLRKSATRVDPWTESDFERLDQLLEQGLSDAEIAEKLGRTRLSITSKRRRLGITRMTQDGKIWGGVLRLAKNTSVTQDRSPASAYRPWTADDVKELEEMTSQGLNDQQIADRMGRSRAAVTNVRRRRLEPPGNTTLERLFHGPKPTRWSEEEIKVLHTLTEQELADLEIARKLGRTRTGVASAKQKYLKHTAEGWRLREKVKFKPRYWTEADLTSLKDLVRQGMKDIDIAEKLNRSEQSVIRQRRVVLGLRKRSPTWRHLLSKVDAESSRADHGLTAPATVRDAESHGPTNSSVTSDTTSSNAESAQSPPPAPEEAQQHEGVEVEGATAGLYPDGETSSPEAAHDSAESQRPWTEPELAQLKQLSTANLSSQNIANKLGRSLTDTLAAREEHGLESEKISEKISRPYTLWTGARLKQLKSLLASGLPEPEVAACLNLTVDALRQIRRRRGIKHVEGERRKTRIWMQSEIDMLKRLRSEGKSIQGIANVVQRSIVGVKWMLKRMRADERKNDGAGTGTVEAAVSFRAWTDEDIATLRRLHVQEGRPLTAVAETMGRSEASVRAFVGKYRDALAREDFAKVLKRAIRPGIWTEEEIDRMMRLFGEGKSMSEVAEVLGRNEKAVQYRKRVVQGRVKEGG